MSDRQQLFLIALGEEDGNVTRACELSGVSRAEYREWMSSSDEFIQGVDDVAEQILDVAVKTLIDAFKDGNLTAAIYYTKCKGKHRGFIERPEATPREQKPFAFEMNFYALPAGKNGEAKLVGKGEVAPKMIPHEE